MNQETENFIEIRGLAFRRGERVIFDNIDMDIPRGKVTGIMGPSGTGKTTLLRLIGAQLKPDAGEIFVDGQNISHLGREELFRARSKMGMLFQSGALFTDLTVFENVAFPLRVHTKLPEPIVRDVVLMKLHAVGLRSAAQLMPAELSGGMARRVALARAVSLDPDFIMYDEPFVGQDPIAMGVLVNLIRKLNTALNLTSVIVSHDLAETASISDYLYLLADGSVIAKGTPEELQDSNDPKVKQFMKGLPDGPVPFHFPGSSLEEDMLGDRS
ncbi:ATP-binding cassette domain-containing protein [Sansalvadorimonas verongulae]|uniref:ATP-binding cassette domain-containing protein n=1 Tax=Sansalvadorimonas verongulae TaxID=2172824 RepID=UPI0012BC056D|nr:ATP-binding cassette domain-containing protein [Sansalvadorimonas verongulae]MTI14845.1 ATP-binding cassette domain-containing protein [Sansalvadorimonas verongulae]